MQLSTFLAFHEQCESFMEESDILGVNHFRGLSTNLMVWKLVVYDL